MLNVSIKSTFTKCIRIKTEETLLEKFKLIYLLYPAFVQCREIGNIIRGISWSLFKALKYILKLFGI